MSLSPTAQSRSELALLADPDKLANRIAQLEAAEASANEVLALVGPANEILKIREQADAELEEAKQVLASAEENAAQIVAAAREDAESIVESAQSEADRLVGVAAERDVDAQERQNAAQANLAETEREGTRLRAWDEALTEKDHALTQRESSLNQTEASLLQEKAQLADLREQISAFVG